MIMSKKIHQKKMLIMHIESRFKDFESHQKIKEKYSYAQ